MNDMNDFFLNLVRTDFFKAQAQETGELALTRLVEIAHQDSEQALIVRNLLLGCYDGANRFNLTDFRRLDLAIFQDCLAVLAMDWACKRELHEYVPHGEEVFRQWGGL